MTGDTIAIADDERALTPLDPNHVKLLRTQAAIMTVPFVIGSLVLEASGVMPLGLFVVPVLIAAVWAVIRVPLRRHTARGYDLATDRLRVVRGLWFRSDTVVPFGRVQHIDVTQGPLERVYGLATLVVHTAGTHNASVTLPGLAPVTAAEMRDAIRAHIKRHMP